MWAVVTDKGEMIQEGPGCLWPDLPADVLIRELRYRDRRGQVGKVEGFESYGFQRFSISPVFGGPAIAHAGTQLIAVRGQTVTVVEINEVTGGVERREFPRAELTYNPELLRDGV